MKPGSFGSVEWTNSWVDIVNHDPQIEYWGKRFDGRVLFDFEDVKYLCAIHKGRIEEVIPDPLWHQEWDFAIRAPRQTWEESAKPMPRPFYQDIFAMMWNHGMVIEGETLKAMQHLRALKLIMKAMRRVG